MTYFFMPIYLNQDDLSDNSLKEYKKQEENLVASFNVYNELKLLECLI